MLVGISFLINSLVLVMCAGMLFPSVLGQPLGLIRLMKEKAYTEFRNAPVVPPTSEDEVGCDLYYVATPQLCSQNSCCEQAHCITESKAYLR